MILTGNVKVPIPADLLAAAITSGPHARSLRFEDPLTFGVKKGAPRRRPRTLTDEQVAAYIGAEQSAMFNFTVMMLEGIAIQEISEWICRCKMRQSRPKEYRPFTKLMEQAMGDYLDATVRYWGDRFDVYSHYFNLALDEVKTMRAIYVHIGMDNEIYKQLDHTKDREAARQLTFTSELLRATKTMLEQKKGKLLEASGAKHVFTADPDVKAMEKACRDMIVACAKMQKAFGLEVEPTKPIRDIVGAFLNRMWFYCQRLLEEEKEARAKEAGTE